MPFQPTQCGSTSFAVEKRNEDQVLLLDQLIQTRLEDLFSTERALLLLTQRILQSMVAHERTLLTEETQKNHSVALREQEQAALVAAEKSSKGLSLNLTIALDETMQSVRENNPNRTLVSSMVRRRLSEFQAPNVVDEGKLNTN